MTDAEMKATVAYKWGQAATNSVWKEDGETLKEKNVDLAKNTLKAMQLCWSVFKKGIPLMDTKAFWAYPEEDPKVIAEMVKNFHGESNVEENGEVFTWVLHVDQETFGEGIAWGTLVKLLIRYSRVYDKLWSTFYCKSITGSPGVN